MNFDSLNNRIFITDEKSIYGLVSILSMFKEKLMDKSKNNNMIGQNLNVKLKVSEKNEKNAVIQWRKII